MAADEYRAKTNPGVDYAHKAAETDASQVSYGKDGKEEYKLINVSSSDTKTAAENLVELLQTGDDRAVRESLGVRVHESLKEKGETLEDIRKIEVVTGHDWDGLQVERGERSLTEVLQRSYKDEYGTFFESDDGKVTFYTGNNVHQTQEYDGRLKMVSIRLHPNQD